MKKFFLSTITVVVAVALSLFSACQTTVLTAYDIAVKNGFSGTEQQWLESLNGRDGTNGKDGQNAAITADELYNSAVERGYTGTYLEFVRDYIGADLTTGDSESAINSAVFSVVRIVSKFSSSSSGGAGVIYRLDKTSGEAYVITNYHVVYNKSETTTDGISGDIKVYLYGYEKSAYGIKAQYIGGSMNYDIAVVKISDDLIKTSDAKAAVVADSNYIAVGSSAIAIGNPDGKGIAATSGIVSVDSEYITMTGADDVTRITFRCMRVDCAVNPGNSGGGLFDAKGRLIGIVNAKIIDSDVENIGYAIPSSLAVAVADNLIWNCDGTANKGVFKGLVGVGLEIAETKAVYDNTTNRARIIETVKVSSISSGSLAEGKLKIGDVVVSVGKGDAEIELTRMFMFVDYMLNARIGDAITLKVIRDGQELTFQFIMQTENFNKIS